MAASPVPVFEEPATADPAAPTGFDFGAPAPAPPPAAFVAPAAAFGAPAAAFGAPGGFGAPAAAAPQPAAAFGAPVRTPCNPRACSLTRSPAVCTPCVRPATGSALTGHLASSPHRAASVLPQLPSVLRRRPRPRPRP